MPSELEAHLAILYEVAQIAASEEKLQREFDRHAPQLRRDLEALEAVLEACRAEADEAERGEWQQACLEWTRALRWHLAPRGGAMAAGGG
jgi:hypothetical protein